MINKQNVLKTLKSQSPFSLLNGKQFDQLFQKSLLTKFQVGQLIIRPDELPRSIHIIVSGSIRLLGKMPSNEKPFTLDKRGPGQIIGWVSLLRAKPSEWVIASEESIALSIDSANFINCILTAKEFRQSFEDLFNIHEVYDVCTSTIANSTYLPENSEDLIFENLNKAVTYSINEGDVYSPGNYSEYDWYLSTNLPESNFCVDKLKPGDLIPNFAGFNLPIRFIGFPSNLIMRKNIEINAESVALAVDAPGSNLYSLGILEEDNLSDEDKYPVATGEGDLNEALAVCEMISSYHNAPFRKDILQKVLDDQFRREKSLSLQLLGRLCELLGMSCQIAEVNVEYIDSIEPPAIILIEGSPCLLYKIAKGQVVYAHPTEGLQTKKIEYFKEIFVEKVSFLLPRRLASTPTSRFGWNWFTPLVIKYKKSLILVFVASLLAQLFGLAIPLLIQQIIDKALSQGNISSLNVLGSVMIILALFQGILTALRTYIFVDTTDRMDLTLGSAVIDRLLALPLSFFDKRPVGELSQRMGELNTIRGFLTGTALVSVLNIVFAILYLVVMLVYSPLLSVVALSTIPIYILMVFVISPIYKFLIRNRAVAQAKTQSHVIEILSGIQTVKAQHFELTARWKWQDRYREYVNQGFKSVALGTTTGVIGGFLNQLSSLLVLWVGMWLVLKGELTLGMLIAFRIISGNVTGPLLQLSGLYQSFQGVQLAMERLSDIIDHNPEFSNADDIDQIPLPPISGDIRFENVKFRFKNNGPYQVNNVSLNISSGQFAAIVGQSGSGKSTLMKLLPRLYAPESGRIFIDDYDIEKVNLSSLRRQIGIVPQDSLLFEGTVAENIALNDPQASTESIIESAKIACAHDFIMSLGQGYASKLSERGSNLSGGQRQRIAIARTVLANPQLLVMDEATSALDYNTEKQLCNNLQLWASGRTVLFITHRLSSIKNSDLIFVMHDGLLVENGSHEQLLQLNGRYAALYSQQGE